MDVATADDSLDQTGPVNKILQSLLQSVYDVDTIADMETTTQMELTESQTAELKRLKSYLPFRLVFGVIRKDSGEFEAYAMYNKRIMNKLAREGHSVFLLA